MRLTHHELAMLIGASERSVYKWEGDEGPPSRKNLLALADALGTTPEYLTTGVVSTERQGSAEHLQGVSRDFDGIAEHRAVTAGDHHEADVTRRLPLKGSASITVRAHADVPGDIAYERGYRDALMDVIGRVTAMGVTPRASSPDDLLDDVASVDEAERGGADRQG